MEKQVVVKVDNPIEDGSGKLSYYLKVEKSIKSFRCF